MASSPISRASLVEEFTPVAPMTTEKPVDEHAHPHAHMTRRVLWKLDTHVLPPLALLWLASFIDRTNIGNAKIAGLSADTHLTGNEFNTALAVFYVLYILVEMPSNWVLKRVGANRWLPFIVALWGTVTTLSGLVESFGGLVAVRLFLGLTEGGLLPGIVLYLSTMYKRDELQIRIGIFYASASLSGAFGGLLATAIIKMDGVGGLAGWRWIFILEGLCTVLIGVFATLIMPRGIATAKFLTEEERDFALARFRLDNQAPTSAPLSDPAKPIRGRDIEKSADEGEAHARLALPSVYQEDEHFEWGEVVRGVTDVQMWLTAFAYLGIIVGLYSYSLFLPTIVSGLGYSGGRAQLHTVPPYIPAIVLTLVVAYISDRLQWRGIFILLLLPITIAGYILAICAKTNEVRYAAVFLMAAGVYPSAPCILSILPNNSSGHYKKATTTACQITLANLGGFVATFAYTSDQAPRYIKGHSIALGFACLAWVLIGANVGYCWWENRQRAAGRREGNVERWRELWDSGKTKAPIGDRHPDFRFVL